MLGKKYRAFSDRTFAAPFGLFQAGGPAESPANEVLVGQRGQRAYFIDLLLHLQRQGAILITGRRGAGKTSFVKYGLAEYEKEVFGRFLNSNIGRVFFWDRFIVALLGLFVLLMALMFSSLLEATYAVANPGEGQLGSGVRFLAWLIVIPLGLICAYPFLFSLELLRQLISIGLRAFSSQGHNSTLASGLSVVAIMIGSGFLWFKSIVGAPAISAGRMFWGICLGFALYTLFSCYLKSDQRKRVSRWLLSFVLFFAVFCLEYLFRPSDPDSSLYATSLLQAIFLLGLGFVGQHTLQVKVGRQSFLMIRECLTQSSTHGVLGMLCLFSYLGFQAFNPGKWTATAGMFRLGLPVIILGLYWGILLFSCGNRKGTASRPIFPLVTLGASAFLCLVLGLQLLHPLLIQIPGSKSSPSAPSVAQVFRPPTQPAKVYAPSSTDEDGNDENGDDPSSTDEDGNDESVQNNDSSSTSDFRLFRHAEEELAWLLALFLSFLVIYYLQYQWVLQPYLHKRQDIALQAAIGKPASKSSETAPLFRDAERRDYRELVALTIPWLLYKHWLPLLTVSVNLGFEKLDHRRVVHAMLAGLRTRYHQRFLAWNSGLANTGRILGFVLFVALVTLIGDLWFNLPKANQLLAGQKSTGEVTHKPTIAEVAANDYGNICSLLPGQQHGSGFINLLCRTSWGDFWFHSLYFDILPNNLRKKYEAKAEHLLFYLVPYRDNQWPPKDVLEDTDFPPLLEKGIEFRVYHGILLLLTFVFGRWVLLRFPMFPYRENLRRIDEVMENLSARTSTTFRSGRWKPAEWFQNLFLDEHVRHAEKDPVDPRTIEFVFLELIEDIQSSGLRLPAGRAHRLSLPSPEVTFIFDELDKLGARISTGEGETGSEAQQAEIIHAERRRSMELYKLLADMKNLLSTAPARFIFVGGRNLHDEWLADQTARQPLLTNIFHEEIYLPSLLIDRRNPETSLTAKIEEYLDKQHERAKYLFDQYERSRKGPSFALQMMQRESEEFSQREAAVNPLCFYETAAKQGPFPGQQQLRRDFIQHLTYRSMGNPKRLKELLLSYSRPKARVVTYDSTRETPSRFDCYHVLELDDRKRFRVQFLADVYRHTTRQLERRLVERDDKLIVSVFFLSDFLLKFHMRAFSWSNLERVDELVHIHRAPDLRNVLKTLIDHLSERSLHPIRNGMYDFRFRSDLAREIEFLSRQSDHEMAAFNFTLDESLTLKSLFESNIRSLQEKDGLTQELQDLVAGLGELHEFDQEYEAARLHYRRAIKLIDEELANTTGHGDLCNDRTPVIQALAMEGTGPEDLQRTVGWGIARLRLMLQIGMTYELSRNLERAQVEYHAAHTLAHSMTVSLLGPQGKIYSMERGPALDILKQLNLLVQPSLAEAWVTEKLAGGVDTSITIAEKGLWELRKILPFLKERTLRSSTSVIQIRHSNFALLGAELHNKVADLYFYKGRQMLRAEELKKRGETIEHKADEGYLRMAHYHYAMSLHELRRYVTHRLESSKSKLNPVKETHNSAATLKSEGWPDFVFRSVGGSLIDLAESMLGRVSLFGLFNNLGEESSSLSACSLPRTLDQKPSDLRDSLRREFTAWLEDAELGVVSRIQWLTTGRKRKGGPLQLKLGDRTYVPLSLSQWLGTWGVNPKQKDNILLKFQPKPTPTDMERLTVALQFMLISTKYIEKGGYLEASARELLNVCEAVTHHIWWYRATDYAVTWAEKWDSSAIQKLKLNQLKKVTQTGELYQHDYWLHLIDTGVYALEKADKLFRVSRRAEKSDTEYLVGDKIPTFCLTLACSLGLAINIYSSAKQGLKAEAGNKLNQRLANLIRSWTGEIIMADKHFPRRLQKILKTMLVRHSFPMINRLYALKTLIDSHVLDTKKVWTEGELEEISNWTLELLDLKSRLDSPMHFTFLDSGMTAALTYFRCREEMRDWKMPDVPELTEIRRSAEQDLRKSEELCTMRKSYHEMIQDNYYLYDDFNDRRFHFSHAMQMAGNELASLLRSLAHVPDIQGEESTYVK